MLAVYLPSTNTSRQPESCDGTDVGGFLTVLGFCMGSIPLGKTAVRPELPTGIEGLYGRIWRQGDGSRKGISKSR